jgi:hypothetical protein
VGIHHIRLQFADNLQDPENSWQVETLAHRTVPHFDSGSLPPPAQFRFRRTEDYGPVADPLEPQTLPESPLLLAAPPFR